MKVFRSTLITGMALLIFAGALPAQTAKQKLKKALRDDNVATAWIYDDIDAGFAAAKNSGKPMLVIFRCVP